MSNENLEEQNKDKSEGLTRLDSLEKSKAGKELIKKLSEDQQKKYVRFVIAAIGSIPWVGGVLSAAASLGAEIDQEEINELQKLWLQEHEVKLEELGDTLKDIFSRLDNFGEEVQQRVESEEYLSLVRSAFKSWDEADTQEKRQMIKKLIANAGATTTSPDDLIRLFMKWIDQYHESHFLVIKEIYKNPRITRGGIWDKIYTDGRPSEDSAEADLFRYLIRELSMGSVVRQERETNDQGEFIKRTKVGQNRGSASSVMESAFEDTKPYVLTELGKKFVHYVIDDVVPQITD